MTTTALTTCRHCRKPSGHVDWCPDRPGRSLTITLSVSIAVDLDTWAMTYGQTPQEAAVDARGYLPDVVRDAVRQQLDRQAAGATVADVAPAR